MPMLSLIEGVGGRGQRRRRGACGYGLLGRAQRVQVHGHFGARDGWAGAFTERKA